MNDQERNELRVKVATLLDWQEVFCIYGVVSGIPPGQKITDDNFTADMPDWPNDLNACNEFEKTLGDLQLQLYVEELVGKKWHEPWSVEDAMGLVVATATQRCQAFVKLHES